MDKSIVEMTDDEIRLFLGAGDPRASNVLSRIIRERPEIYRQVCIDIQDMQMTGQRLWTAHKYFCNEVLDMFIEMCAARNLEMVELVNKMCGEPYVRQHGPQKALPNTVDAAVKNALMSAEQEGTLKRMDENAEVIHNFFSTMLVMMQESGKFVSNFKLNLGPGNGWGVFAITFVEMLDADGKPRQRQINKEEVPSQNTTITPKTGEG